MTVNPYNDNPRNPRLDENDPVWGLLARAPLPEPDAWFTTRTLARCREETPEPKLSWTSIGRVWRWALGGGLGVCLAVTLMMTQTPPHPASTDDQQNVQEAFEIVASVGSEPGSDTDSSSSSTWQDSSSR